MCPYCASAGYTYDVKCLGCCVRMIRRASPNKHAASGLLAAIERMPGTPARTTIFAAMKEAA